MDVYSLHYTVYVEHDTALSLSLSLSLLSLKLGNHYVIGALEAVVSRVIFNIRSIHGSQCTMYRCTLHRCTLCGVRYTVYDIQYIVRGDPVCKWHAVPKSYVVREGAVFFINCYIIVLISWLRLNVSL